MNRYLLSTAFVLAAATMASAHFVFLVPDGNSGSVKAVFSDSLKPDPNVSIEKIENTKLTLIDSAGKESALKWTVDKPGAFWKIEAAGSGSRIVAGVTDYGVLQRGDTKPFWLKYYSKTILGDLPSVEKGKIGKAVPLEIVPVIDGGKLYLFAFVAGKPAANMEISVLTPDDKTIDMHTDAKGITRAFDEAGMYGARIRLVEAKTGEDKGKKYEELRHYATLVVNFAPAK